MACGPNSRGLMARGPDPNASFPVRFVAARDGVNFARPELPRACGPRAHRNTFIPVRSVAARDGVNFAPRTPAALWPAGPTPTPSSQSVFWALRPIGCYELLDPLQS